MVNWKVLRDKKTLVYFIISFISLIVAIGFAVIDNSVRIVLVVSGNIFLLIAVFRAQKITYKTKGR